MIYANHMRFVDFSDASWESARKWIAENIFGSCFVFYWPDVQQPIDVDFPLFIPRYLLFTNDKALALFILFWAHHIRDSRY